eukprot:11005504-Karenia_brevis.AAC.1
MRALKTQLERMELGNKAQNTDNNSEGRHKQVITKGFSPDIASDKVVDKVTEYVKALMGEFNGKVEA